MESRKRTSWTVELKIKKQREGYCTSTSSAYSLIIFRTHGKVFLKDEKLPSTYERLTLNISLHCP